MPRIAYGAGAYRRDNGSMPEMRLINMFLEAAPADEAGVILLSRQGLSENSTPGNGPITGMFRADGVFDGDLFTVSGGVLYREGTSFGTIVGEGPVSFAASDTELAVTAGGTLYRYSEADGLDAVTFPDDQDVLKIAYHDGLFLAVAGGGQRWYFSAVLDADSWNALDFASAESAPDTLLDMEVLGDAIWLFGAETIEPWANTGDAELPYSRIEGRTFSKGIYSTGCLVKLDNTLMFVGHDGICYRVGDVPERISDHGIEERIKTSVTISAFGFVSEGHSFFCIRLEGGTFAFDISTGQWCELQTYERSNFRGQCAINVGDEPLFGDDEEGKTWALSGYEDAGGTLERLFTAGFPIHGGTLTADNLMIEANVGYTELLTGQGSDPVAELRLSRDAGATWSVWRSANLGRQGRHRTRTAWRRLGMFDFPGAVFEVRVTDPYQFRISGVYLNEAGGGRSR